MCKPLVVPPESIGIDLAESKRTSSLIREAGLLADGASLGELECILAARFAAHRETVERLCAPRKTPTSSKPEEKA